MLTTEAAPQPMLLILSQKFKYSYCGSVLSVLRTNYLPQSGSYQSLTSSWLACTSTTEPLSNKREDGSTPSIENDIGRLLTAHYTDASTSITPLECPIVWAREANAYDCVSRGAG
jgi:hypothetical protein